MNNIAFDTLQHTNTLKRYGFTQEQAEGITETTSSILIDFKNNGDLATKSDVQSVRNELYETRNALKSDIQELKIELIKLISASTWKTVGILATFQVITLGMFGLMKYFIK